MQRWNLHDVEIVKYVLNGLQPYDNAMQPMLPPHAAEWSYLVRELKAEINDIVEKFPAIQKSDYRDWSILNLDRQADADNQLIKIQFPDGSNSEIRGEYEEKVAQLERLEIKFNKYSALPSWIGYELSNKKTDGEAVVNQLLNALYKRSDIDNLEKNKIGADSRDNQSALQDGLPQERGEKKFENAFVRCDGYWEIWYQGLKLKPVIHVEGLIYIAHLLDHPNVEINVSALYETFHPKEGIPMVSSSEVSHLLNTGEMSISDMSLDELDATARTQISQQITALKKDIAAAETQIEKKESEDELKELIKTVKRYGKNQLSKNAPKHKNESVKKHADAVRNASRLAIDKIHKRSPSLAEYLASEKTIKRGKNYIYKDTLIWSVFL